jgi:hypothetical protein
VAWHSLLGRIKLIFLTLPISYDLIIEIRKFTCCTWTWLYIFTITILASGSSCECITASVCFKKSFNVSTLWDGIKLRFTSYWISKTRICDLIILTKCSSLHFIIHEEILYNSWRKHCVKKLSTFCEKWWFPSSSLGQGKPLCLCFIDTEDKEGHAPASFLWF